MRTLTWATSTSIWQSIIAAACIAATLLFTAFDLDYKGSDLAQVNSNINSLIRLKIY